MYEKVKSHMRLLSDRPINRRQKYATFLLERFETPHPRINDGAKPQGALIIEPGAGGFIIELGVRGIAKNCKNVM